MSGLGSETTAGPGFPWKFSPHMAYIHRVYAGTMSGGLQARNMNPRSHLRPNKVTAADSDNSGLRPPLSEPLSSSVRLASAVWL